MTLEQVLNAANFNVVEGFDYGWDWAGKNSYAFEFSVNPTDVSSNAATVVFDRVTKEVLQVSVYFYTGEDIAYNWVNLGFFDAFVAENIRKNVDPNIAYDDVIFTMVDKEFDILGILNNAFGNKPYDPPKMEIIDIKLSTEELAALALIAHDQDKTVNETINDLLKSIIEEIKEVNGWGND